MANEIRLRRNNMAGTITDNPLSMVSTTINSPGFVDLPTIGGTNSMILILDPLEINGPAEIVLVTAHTAAATSVTVTRGVEGSAPRAHILGTTWFHGPVTSDYTEVLTSSTRPSIPYEGEFIYETDTNKLVGFGGTDWAPRDAGGTLGYAQATTDQTSITTIVDLTNLSVAVTVGTGRRIKITGFVSQFNRTAGTVTFVSLAAYEGATELNRCTAAMPNTYGGMAVHAVLSPSGGSHTYKLRAFTDGTVTLIAGSTVPAFILVEDIGAA